MIKFFIKAKPHGKQRTAGKKRRWTPKETRVFEEKVAYSYLSARNKCDPDEKVKWDAHEPVEVIVRMQYKCAKSNLRTKAQREAVLNGTKRPTIKPDVDNVVKSVFDGLNKIAYHDDAQIVKLSSEKVYAKSDDEVGLWITIRDADV